MSYLNRIELLGNVGNAPEVLENTKGSKKFVKVSLATSASYVDSKGNKQVKTSWHIIYFNDRLAAIAETHIQKGSRIYVTGKLNYKEWKDKNGEHHINAFVLSTQLILLDSKTKTNDIKSEEMESSMNTDQGCQNLDDIPF